MGIEYKTYKIKSLHLDPRNPRVGRGAETESEAARRLLSNHGSSIRGLAKDIAMHGLDPLAPWAVVKENNRLVVLEGNRRLMACRLLIDASKANDESWEKSFRRITRVTPLDQIGSARCVLFERRADARHWIELKHHGLGEGEGTDSWEPEMIYIDQLQNGGKPEAWNEFWYWIEDTYSDDPEILGLLDAARSYQYTGMERVYKTSLPKLIKADLNDNGKLSVQADHRALRPFVRKLMEQMGKEGSINSRTINIADDAKAVVKELFKKTVTTELFESANREAADDEQTGRGMPGGKNDADEQGASTETPQDRTTTTGTSGGGKPKPTKAETNLYAGIPALSGLPGRLKDLLSECRDIVIVDQPETASVMARVGLELTLDAFIAQNGLKVKGKRDLFDKVKTVLFSLDPKYDQKEPNRADLTGVWASIRTDQQVSGHMIKDLNDCVHSYQFTATLDIAKRANRVLTPLMVAVVENLRQT